MYRCDNIRKNFLFSVKWVFGMFHAKNYETASTFVRVIQRKLLASFFRTRCIVDVQGMLVGRPVQHFCSPVLSAPMLLPVTGMWCGRWHRTTGLTEFSKCCKELRHRSLHGLELDHVYAWSSGRQLSVHVNAQITRISLPKCWQV